MKSSKINPDLNTIPVVSKRLLRAANPRAKNESDYTLETVDEALMRNGLGCALLLAMENPLAHALHKTFQMMLGLKLDTIEPPKPAPMEGTALVGTIAFSGRASGVVNLRLSSGVAQDLAMRVLGRDHKEQLEPGEVTDTVGELLNIITGNFKSNLCDAGLDCKLEPPQVTQASRSSDPQPTGGMSDFMEFRTGNITLRVDLQVNPLERRLVPCSQAAGFGS